MYNPNQRRGLYQKSMTRQPVNHGQHKRLEKLDPNGMARYLNNFLAWCDMMGRTKETCRSYYYDLYQFKIKNEQNLTFYKNSQIIT
jgi:hypothetical protein